MTQPRDFFCPLPWAHLQALPDGRIFPCCVSKEEQCGSLKDTDIEGIWNGESMRRIRRQMLAGEVPRECAPCAEQERIGVYSHRQRSLAAYPELRKSAAATDPSGSFPLEKLDFVEIRFSNLCNFRCRTCGPTDSSAWYRESRSLEMTEVPKTVISLKQVAHFDSFVDAVARSCKRIHFAGGEPLLHEEHYRLLEKLIERGRTDVGLSYNTNLSVLSLKQWDVLKLWKKFAWVTPSVSVDGLGPQGEYVRKGFKSAVFEKNLAKLMSSGLRGLPRLQMTISAINIFHIPEAIDRFLSLGFLKEADQLELTVVHNPRHYSFRVLTEKERGQVRSLYEGYGDSLVGLGHVPPELARGIQERLRSVLLNFECEFQEQERREFARITRSLDRLRKESFASLFPQLASLTRDESAESSL